MTVNTKLETMPPEELRDIAIKLGLDMYSGKSNDQGLAGLSRLLDCSRETVRRYCAGKRRIPPNAARLLREMVRAGRNPADFLRDTNKRYRPMVRHADGMITP